MNSLQYQRGYIALVTTVVLGLVLLTLLLVASNTSLLARFNILDAESKEVSRQLARACLDIARVKVAQNKSYVGNEVLAVGEYVCWVRPRVEDAPIQAQAVINSAYTNLEIDVNGSEIQECAYFEDDACVPVQ